MLKKHEAYFQVDLVYTKSPGFSKAFITFLNGPHQGQKADFVIFEDLEEGEVYFGEYTDEPTMAHPSGIMDLLSESQQ